MYCSAFYITRLSIDDCPFTRLQHRREVSRDTENQHTLQYAEEGEHRREGINAFLITEELHKRDWVCRLTITYLVEIY
jgi:hypothetical protein